MSDSPSTPVAKVQEFNILQKKALEAYHGGDHPVKTPSDAAGCDDLLLRLILEELSDLAAEPKKFLAADVRTACYRLEAAIEDLGAIYHALREL